MKSFKEWLKEMVGTDAIVSSCRPTADYQVFGACSDLNDKRSNAGTKNRSTKKVHGSNPRK